MLPDPRTETRAKLTCAAIVLLTGVASACPAASAPAAVAYDTIDLLDGSEVRIDGAGAGDSAGNSLSPAGDVNGDGRDDFLVGAPDAQVNGRPKAGVSHVVFGRGLPGVFDLALVGMPGNADGFRIEGAFGDDASGHVAAPAGDVNDDGRDDVLVGAYAADNNARPHSGSAYVIFGKASAATVELAKLGSAGNTAGYRIDGAGAWDYAGWAVAGVGDMNGDGRSEVAVGAPEADFEGAQSGSAHVVFGKESSGTVDLAALPPGSGFRVAATETGDNTGVSLAGTPDMNGDGLPELVVGAHLADPGGTASGAAYVIFGKASAATVDTSQLGEPGNTAGFRINGAAAEDTAGWSVASTGDMNGDHLPEIVIGSPGSDGNGRADSGSAYAVYGRATAGTLELGEIGPLESAPGFRVDGAAPGDSAGSSVSRAGDMNGDYRSDLAIGAPGADNNARTDSGSASVIFGAASSGAIDLANLGSGSGFRADGAATGDRAGSSVAGAGDMNGDGLPELAIGAPRADNNARTDSGSAYLVYGRSPAQEPEPPGSDPPANEPPGLTSSGSGTFASASGQDRQGAACRLQVPSPSGSRWRRVGDSMARVRGPAGGHVRDAGGVARFAVQAKRRGRRSRAALRAVTFRLAGATPATDRRAPFRFAVDPAGLRAGDHEIEVTVRPRRGRKRTLRLRFAVSDCRPATLATKLRPRRRGRYADVSLTTESGGTALAGVSFRIPGSIRWRARHRSGTRIGRLKVSDTSGVTSRPLRLPPTSGRRNAKQPVALLGGGRLEALLSSRGPRAVTIAVSGIEAFAGATRVTVSLKGRHTRLLRNPRRCRRAAFRAALSALDGASITLVRREKIAC